MEATMKPRIAASALSSFQPVPVAVALAANSVTYLSKGSSRSREEAELSGPSWLETRAV